MQQLFICIVTVVIFGYATSAPVHGQNVTDQQVTEAIRKGVKYLYDQQAAWGNWDEKDEATADRARKSQFGGWTALVLDGLLSAGEEYQGNPKLQKAMDFLAKCEPPGTYAAGLRAHVWPQLPDRFLEYLKVDQYRLEAALSDGGAYHYPLTKLPPYDWDNSCTQYGVLGGWECQKRGVPMSQSYWARVEKHFLDTQNADGGWAYRNGEQTTQNMTAAGLACLSITEDYLHAQEFVRPGVAENHPVHKRIAMGVGWFDKNFVASSDAYGMVGVERVGLASGRKYFKGTDWYRAGAAGFIKGQGAAGNMGAGHPDPIGTTAFALIFLSRGRVPTFVNKLEIPGFPWSNRPRDMANVTAWASDEFEAHMNWQVVGIDREPADWMDAPILYLAGHRPLELTADQLSKLKMYLDMGGLLVVNADGSSRAFVDSVTQAFEKIYPYKFKPLAVNDYLMNMVFPIRRADMLAMDNGVRHMIVILTRDPAANWQVNNMRDIDDWHLMGNIFEYAIEKTQPRNRLEIHTETQTKTSEKVVHVGRARYAGNWNPEPMAWASQSIFDNNKQIANPKTHTLDLAAIGDADVSMIHVIGTDTVEFTADQIKAIQSYVTKGGVILFETAGGQPAFTESVRQMLANAFPASPVRRLSLTSPVITGSGLEGAFNNSHIEYRMFYKQRLGVSNQPSLQAMIIDDQPRILVSAEDMSNAMLGQPVWGIFGYNTNSARQLMTNILLYARSTHPASGNIPAE